jgi:hypothetical protein
MHQRINNVLATSPTLVTPILGVASATSITLGTALAVTSGGTGVISSTGSGSNVLSTSPTLVTPILGAATGTSLQLSGLTASQSVATDASKNLISVANTGTGNNVLATSPTLVTPILGVASATSLTLSTALAVANGGTGVTTSTGSGSVVLATSPILVTPILGAATGTSLQLAGLTASSALATDALKNLISVATTGTGNYVLNTSPTLITPILGAASATSLTLSTALSVVNGGTGQTSLAAVTVGTATNIAGGTLGLMPYQTASNTTGFTAPGATGTILTSNGPALQATFQLPAAVNLTSGVSGVLPVANGGTGVTTSTGSGANVLSTSPTLVTPILGAATGTSLALTNALDVTSGGTGVTTSTGTGSNVLNTSPTLVTPVLGAATGTSLQLSGLVASQAVATDSLKNLISVATTGSGNYVLNTSPTLITPILGAASATSLILSTALAVASGGTGVTTSTGTGSVVLSTSPTLVTPVLGVATATSLTLSTVLAVASGGTGVVSSTGSGSNVLNTSPTLVTPILGAATGTSLQLSGLTASSALATDASKNLISVANTGTGNNVLATSPTLITPVLGAASATSLTLSTALAVASGGTGVTTSTGSGANVLSTSPTLITPVLGVASATSLTLSTALAVTSGGTGGTTSTGTGSVVLATSPTLVTPVLGAATGTSLQLSGLMVSSSIATDASKNLISVANTGTGNNVLATSPTISNMNANNTIISNLAEPVSSTDAATKNYVDLAVQGLSTKKSAVAATTIAGTLATSFSNASVIDGVTLTTGDRILIKDQANSIENGIYIVTAGSPTRASDLANGSFAAGIYVFIEEGTVNADSGWVCISDDGSDIVGTNSLSFAQFTSAGIVTAGTGLTKTGNTLSVNASQTQITAVGTLTTGTWNATTIAVANGGTGVTTSTGTGSNVLNTSPTLVTPVLGAATGTSLQLSGLTVSSALATDSSKNLISVANTGTGNNVLATSPTLITPVLGAASATSLTLGTALAVASGGTGVTTSTGTGSVVLSTSPTLVTPVLGVATGTSLQLSGLTVSSALATDASKNLISVANTGTGNNVLATSPTLVTPVLGVASATSLTLGTALAVASGGTGVTTSTGSGANVLSTSPTLVTPVLGAATGTSLQLSGLTVSSALATDASKNLISVANTGTGNNVLATSPTLVTPVLGAASATSLTLGTALAVASGGTGQTSLTLINVGSATNIAGGSIGLIPYQTAANSTAFITPGAAGTILTSNGPTAQATFVLPALVDLTTGVSNVLPVTNGGTGVTTSTGSGSNVLSTSPTLVTPILGVATATSLTLSTALSVTNGGTGSTTASGTGAVVRQTSPTLITPIIGAAIGTSLQLSGLTASSAIATDASKNLISVATTGSGSYVLSSSPTITNINANSTKIINLAEPTVSTDAATKNYIDVITQSASAKTAVLAATTLAGTLATSFSNASVIDGVTLTTGDRILIKNQANPIENGIYIVTAGSPTRSSDLANGSLAASMYVFVNQGTVNISSGWVCDSSYSSVVGTNSLTFTQFTVGALTAGTGLTKTGNTLSVNASQTQITAVGTLTTGTWNATTIAVANGGTGVTTSTGTGANVLNTSPTLVTPVLGAATGTSLQLSSLSASQSVATDASKNLISVANTGTGNNVLATSPTLVTPVLGAASATSLTLGTALAVASGGTGVTTSTGTGSVVLSTSPTLVTPVLGVATGTSLQLSGLTVSSALATDASKNLISVANTGTGNNVLATSPTLVTPVLGAASATSLTLGTALAVASGGTGVTTSTGSGSNVLSTSPTLVTPVLGAASATSLTLGTALVVASGGTGQTSLAAVTVGTATNVEGGTANNVVYQTAPNTTGFISPSTINSVLTSNGTGAPPTFKLPTRPTLQILTSGTTYTPTSTDVLWIKVTVIGGGGGSSGFNNTGFSGGGGGGALLQAYAPATSYTYAIGAGGTAGAAANSAAGNGGNGGTTTFGTSTVYLMTANGGVGSTIGTTPGGTGGTIGAVGASITITNSIQILGQTANAGAVGSNNGGSSGLGYGTGGTTSATGNTYVGNSGKGYGAGASGRGGNSVGGAGTTGAIIVEEFYS